MYFYFNNFFNAYIELFVIIKLILYQLTYRNKQYFKFIFTDKTIKIIYFINKVFLEIKIIQTRFLLY